MIMTIINSFFLIILNSKKLKSFYFSLTNLYKIYFYIFFNCLDNKTKIKLNIFFTQLNKLLFVGSIIIDIIQFISLALFFYKLFKFTSIDIILSWLIFLKIKFYIKSLIKSYIVNVISFIIDNNNSIEQVYNKIIYKIFKDHYIDIITVNVILIYFSYSYKSLFFIVIAGLILGLTLLYFSTMLFIYINYINKNIKNKSIIYLLLLTISLILIVLSLLIIRLSLNYINDYLKVKINESNSSSNTGPLNPTSGSEGGIPSGPNGPSGGQPSGDPSRPPGENNKSYYIKKNISKYKRKTYEENREAKRKRDERDVLLQEEDPEAYDARVESYKFNTRAKRVMTLDEYERRKKLRERRDLANMRNINNSSFNLNLEGRSGKDLEIMIAEGNRIREEYIEGNLPQTEQNPSIPCYTQETEQNLPVSHIGNISQSQGFRDNQNYFTHDSRFSYTLHDNVAIPYNSQSQIYMDYSMQNPPMNYSNNNPYLYDYNNNPYLQNNYNNPNVQNNTISDNYSYNNPVIISTNNPVTTNNSTTKVNITDLLNTTKNSSNLEQNRINISDMLNTPKQQSKRINVSDMINSPRPESKKIKMKDILNP